MTPVVTIMAVLALAGCTLSQSICTDLRARNCRVVVSHGWPL